jgi:hypothetical protein
LSLPDSGPPEDVIRTYLEPEQPRAVFAATRVAVPEPRRPSAGEEQPVEGVEGEMQEWSEEELEDPGLAEEPEAPEEPAEERGGEGR